MDERVAKALDRVLDRLLQLTAEERSARIARHIPGFVYHTYADNGLAKSAAQSGVSFKMSRDLHVSSNRQFHAELQWHHETVLQEQNVSYGVTNPSGKSVTWLQAA